MRKGQNIEETHNMLDGSHVLEDFVNTEMMIRNVV